MAKGENMTYGHAQPAGVKSGQGVGEKGSKEKVAPVQQDQRGGGIRGV